MATIRIIPMHINKGKTIAQCLSDWTEYAINPDKTEAREFVSSFACAPKTADMEFFLYRNKNGQGFSLHFNLESAYSTALVIGASSFESRYECLFFADLNVCLMPELLCPETWICLTVAAATGPLFADLNVGLMQELLCLEAWICLTVTA